MTTLPRALLLLLLATVPASAATLYVSQQGSDSHPCSQSAPCRTVNGGIARMSGGDTLVIGPGTYEEVLTDIGGPPGYRVVPIPAGSPSAFTTLKAATPGSVTLRARRGGWDSHYLIAMETSASRYIRFESLVIDLEYQAHGMSTCGSIGDGARRIEFRDIDCKNGDMGYSGTGTDIHVIGGRVHGHGWNARHHEHCMSSDAPPMAGYCHGTYQQYGGGEGRWVIDGVHFYDNAGYGVHSYHTNIVVKNSVFSDHHTGGIVIVGAGGEVLNNCLERNPTPILCNGCRQEGNRIDPPGGCGRAVPSPTPPPAPQPCPAPFNLRIVTAP